MTNHILPDDNISFVKNNNPKNQEIPYLVHSTWNIHATEGKVGIYKGLPRNEKSKVGSK